MKYKLKRIPITFTFVFLMLVLFCISNNSIKASAGQYEPFFYSVMSDGGIMITEYDNSVKGTLVVPEEIDGKPVTVISGYTFQNADFEAIVLPKTLKRIDSYSFSECKNLKKIVIPDNVTEIWSSAFSHCKKLEEVKLGNGVKTIESAAFYECASLKTVEVGNKLKKIENSAFLDCVNLLQITLPDTVTTIESSAFMGCSNLKSVKLGNGLTKLGGCVFKGCSSLESIKIPDTLKTIEMETFKDCSSLKTVDTGNGLREIKKSAFSGAGVESIKFSANLYEIGDKAFLDCKALKTLTLPDSLLRVGESVFYGCSALKTAKLSNNMVYVGNKMFGKCTSLEKVTVGIKTTSIGNYAFSNCKKLAEIKIPDNVIYIENAAFEYCKGLKNVTLGNSVRIIYYAAFWNCTNLEKIDFKKNVETIGGYAFCECQKLEKIVLPGSIRSIESSSFFGCSNLKSVTIMKEASGFGDGAFNENATIYGYGGTYAQTYAKKCGYKFKCLHTKTTKQTTATTSSDGSYVVSCKDCKAKLENRTIPKISSVILSKTSYAYNGEAKKPSVTVKDSKGKTLKNGTDYTVTYSANKEIGTAKVKVSFKGDYSGSKTPTFKILPANPGSLKATQTTTTVKLSWSKVTGAGGYRVYRYDSANGKYVKLADVTGTTYKAEKLKAGTSYKFSVRAFKKIGSDYYLSASYPAVSTATKCVAPTLKAAAGTSKANLSWNKVAEASGYEIYYSTGKNAEYKKAATITNAATLKYTQTKLKKGSTYNFKIVAYKNAGGSKINSAYSPVVSVKIK